MSDKDLKPLLTHFYREEDAQGMYLGCFEPVYYLYKELPHYPLTAEHLEFDFSYNRLLEHFKPLQEGESYMQGDIMVFKTRWGYLHCGIYIGDERIIHVRKGHFHEIHPLKLLRSSLYSVLRKNSRNEEGSKGRKDKKQTRQEFESRKETRKEQHESPLGKTKR